MPGNINEIIKLIDGLIWSWVLDFADAVLDRLPMEMYSYVYFNGAHFDHTQKINVLVINIKLSSSGLNTVCVQLVFF